MHRRLSVNSRPSSDAPISGDSALLSAALPASIEARPVPAAHPKRKHLDQIDLIRALTVIGVLSVHATYFSNALNSFGAGTAIMLLHYTREAFLFITGFVLFYTYRSSPVKVLPFWRRRFQLIGIPYVVWSTVYTAVHLDPSWAEIGLFVHTLLINLLLGRAWYHLYYLLITMQVYLLFPLFQRFLVNSRPYHRWLLAASFSLEVVMMAVYQYHLPVSGFVGWLMRYRTIAFFTYQFYLLAGALAAIHLSSLNAWVARRGRQVATAWGVALLAALAWYVIAQAGYGQPVIVASAVFQPIMVPYCLFTILVLYALGVRWASAPRKGLASRLMNAVSRHSFGIYLIHPLMLYFILNRFGTEIMSWWPGVRTLFLIAVTLVVSYGVVWAISTTPFSLYLLGRPQDAKPPWADGEIVATRLPPREVSG